MDSLKELTTFLKTRQNGASMSELREVFSDDKQLKMFIQSGIDNDVIFKDGEKRGTRYYAMGKTPTHSEKKQTKEQKHTDDYSEETIECSGWESVDVYLASNKPINGQGVFSRCENFGNNDINNVVNFLKSGRRIETVYIQYDSKLKKNVIIQRETNVLNNKIAFKRDGKNLSIVFFTASTSKFQIESCGNYEELRESVRRIFK